MIGDEKKIEEGSVVRKRKGTNVGVTGFWLVEDISPDGRKMRAHKHGKPATSAWFNVADFEVVDPHYTGRFRGRAA